MSEFTDLVSDMENLIKQKPVILADIANLQRNKQALIAELDVLGKSLDSIKTGIEIEREKAKNEIKTYNEHQAIVIRKEIDRLNKAAEATNALISKNMIVEAEQRQRENELNALHYKLVELEKSLNEKDSSLKSLQVDLNKKHDDSTIKLNKVESHIKEIRRLFIDNEQLKVDLEKQMDSTKEQLAVLSDKKNSLLLELRQFNNEKSEFEASKLEVLTLKEKLHIEIADAEKQRLFLDKRKKDLDDKQRALEAEKAELAFQSAKISAKEKKK